MLFMHLLEIILAHFSFKKNTERDVNRNIL